MDGTQIVISSDLLRFDTEHLTTPLTGKKDLVLKQIPDKEILIIFVGDPFQLAHQRAASYQPL